MDRDFDDRQAAGRDVLQPISGRRVLVTGAGGFLGSHLIERLVAEKAIVLGLARHRGKLSSVKHPDIAFYSCDLTDSHAVQSALASFRPEALLHVAAHPDAKESLHQARDAIECNLIGTVNVLEAFRLCGGSLFVYGDTSKVYGDSAVPYRESTPVRPLSSYAIAKAAGWEFCRLYSRIHELCCVSVRPTMIYGPRQSFNLITFVVNSILDGASHVQLDGGSQTRTPLFVDDAINAFVDLMRRGNSLSGRVVNVGGSCEMTVQEIAAQIASLMGSSIRIVCATDRKRLTDMQRSVCDNSEAEALLGWRPKVDFREGLTRTLETLAAKRIASGALAAAADRG